MITPIKTDTLGLHSIRRILYLQKDGVLSEQIAVVRAYFEAKLPEVELTFASSADMVPQGEDFDVIITPTLPWLPSALARLGGYRWIHFLSAGIEKIWEMDFDKERSLMTKSSGVHGAPMSEYALGAMLYFTKQFGRFFEQSQNAEWRRTWLGELTGCQLTVLGLGHIGQCLARRAKAFDMKVVGTLRNLRAVEHVDRVLPMAAIEEELACSDFLVVCLPLTQSTKGLVGDNLLSKLKPGAVLIDISRGGVVDADAVLRNLECGILKGAALDVFAEQPLPKDSPLWGRSDVLITPHVSGTSPFYLQRALDVFMKNVISLSDRGEALTSVDLISGY